MQVCLPIWLSHEPLLLFVFHPISLSCGRTSTYMNQFHFLHMKNIVTHTQPQWPASTDNLSHACALSCFSAWFLWKYKEVQKYNYTHTNTLNTHTEVSHYLQGLLSRAPDASCPCLPSLKAHYKRLFKVFFGGRLWKGIHWVSWGFQAATCRYSRDVGQISRPTMAAQ